MSQFHKSPFSIICVHILKGCPEKFRKVLDEDAFYFFNNWYKQVDGKIINNNVSTFEKTFFGENISIQAVVGMNGSGKSSLFEFIYRILNNFSYVASEGLYRATAEPLYYIRGLKAELYFEMEGQLGVVSCEDDKVSFKYGDLPKQELQFPGTLNYRDEEFVQNGRMGDVWVQTVEKIHEDTLHRSIINKTLKHFFYTLVINYSIQSLSPCDFEDEEACGEDEEDKCPDGWITSLYNKNDGYLVPFGIEPYRAGNILDLKNQKELTEDRLIALLLYAKQRNKALNGNGNEITLIPGYELDEVLFSLDKLFFKKSRKDDKDKQHLLDIVNNPNDSRCNTFMIGYGITTQYTEDDNYKKKLWIVGMEYLINKTFSIAKNYPSYEEYNDLAEDFFDIDTPLPADSLEKLEQLIKKIRKEKSHISTKIQQVVKFLNGLEGISEEDSEVLYGSSFIYDKYTDIFDYRIVEDQEDELTHILHSLPPSIFKHTIFLIDKVTGHRAKFSKLSSGQRQYAYTIASYIYHLQNLISVPDTDNRVKYNNVNLIFDEIELCYHPEYQRSYIFNLIQSIHNFGLDNHLNINIILSTHSPFVLSDIPLSNILMLKDGHVQRDDDGLLFNPLGANVNDLLKQRFFLSHGFVGEYVRQRINSLVNYLEGNQENTWIWDDKSSYQFISLIGEPFIKEQLMGLYAESERIDKQDKIQMYQHELDKLKGDA